MLVQIDRQEAIDKYPILPLQHYDPDEDEGVSKYPKVFANYVLTLPSKSYKGHIKLLAAELFSFANNFVFDKFTFLGDLDIAWLRRLNTYDSFKEALQYLVDNRVSKRFNGALQVDTTEISTFIKHLAWLVRTNGILPYVHFTDPGQNVTGNICQYGNLHISTKNKTADKKFKNVIFKSSFTYLTEKSCYNKFSKSNVIKRRTIIV